MSRALRAGERGVSSGPRRSENLVLGAVSVTPGGVAQRAAPVGAKGQASNAPGRAGVTLSLIDWH